MHHLFFFLFFTASFNVINGMDQNLVTKSRSSSSSSGERKPFLNPLRKSQGFTSSPIVTISEDGSSPTLGRSRRARSSSSSSNIFRRLTKSQESDVSTIERTPENVHAQHGLLIAAKNNDAHKIAFYLNNPYLNPNLIFDSQGNTGLHVAAQHRSFDVLDVLLKDPRSNACITNNDRKMPSQLLKKPDPSLYQSDMNENGDLLWLPGFESECVHRCLIYKRRLFARFTLNNMVNNCAPKIQPAYSQGHIDQKAVDGTVKKIKNDVLSDIKNQDASLPPDAQLPTYATDEFIDEMLLFALAQRSQK